MSKSTYLVLEDDDGLNPERWVKGAVYETQPFHDSRASVLARGAGATTSNPQGIYRSRFREATLDDAYSTTYHLDGSVSRGAAGALVKQLNVQFDTETSELEALLGQPAGRKDDSGKLDYTLLDDMPNALAAVVEVMQWAITQKKPVPYERGSWQGVEPDRYRAAVLRHNAGATAQAIGSTVPVRQQRDVETNLLHLAHQATSALMALESTIREMKRV